MRNWFSTISVFLICIQLTAQQTSAPSPANKKTDSLLQLLKVIKEDTARISLLQKIADQYIKLQDYNNALPYAKEGVALADKTGMAEKRALEVSNVIGKDRCRLKYSPKYAAIDM